MLWLDHKLCNRRESTPWSIFRLGSRSTTRLFSIPYILRDCPTTIVNINSRSAREHLPKVTWGSRVVDLFGMQYIREITKKVPAKTAFEIIMRWRLSLTRQNVGLSWHYVVWECFQRMSASRMNEFIWKSQYFHSFAAGSTFSLMKKRMLIATFRRKLKSFPLHLIPLLSI